MSRRKYRFFDLTLIVIGTVVVLYVGLTLDIFANAPNHTPKAETLEFDELMGAHLRPQLKNSMQGVFGQRRFPMMNAGTRINLSIAEADGPVPSKSRPAGTLMV